MNTVYTLYRVSTKQQVDKTKDDIPMQREACHEFADHMGWTIGKEFLEKGVSGFKVSASDRDAIQDLKAAALNKEFDILLVFMFDRIGRIDDETPFIVEWFVKQGIRVWSVQEGEQRFESHVDKLMNYIRFWQASGESEKTSMRIRTRMNQLVSEGVYRGGPVPFGYQLVNNGRLNKKGKPLYDIEVDPVEADWVRLMFEKTVKEGYGTHRIANLLNEKGVKTHNGSKFQCNTVNRILRNEMVTGYMVTKNARSPFLPQLKIVDEPVYNRVQEILEQRVIKNEERHGVALTTRGQDLLSGMMYCGHCGGYLTSYESRRKHTLADGTVKAYVIRRYMCYHKCRHLCDCDGQGTYNVDRIDRAVNAAVKEMFGHIKDAPDEKALNKVFNKEAASCKAQKTKLNLELSRLNKQKEKLGQEILKVLMGESCFESEQLSTLLKNIQAEINVTVQKIETLDSEVAEKKASIDNIRPQYESFRTWAEEYDKCTVEQKKMIISQLVDRIEVCKGYKINIVFNMTYKQFCEDWNTATGVSII